jgi:hypothetical protein
MYPNTILLGSRQSPLKVIQRQLSTLKNKLQGLLFAHSALAKRTTHALDFLTHPIVGYALLIPELPETSF